VIGTLEQVRDPGESLYRSEDGCDWTPPEGLTGRVVTVAAFDRAEPSRAVAGTGDLTPGARNALLYSEDGGRSWSESEYAGADRLVTRVDAPGSGAFWASTLAPSGAPPSLLRSTDGGRTWSGSPVDPVDWGAPADTRVRLLIASPDDPETAWVVLSEY